MEGSNVGNLSTGKKILCIVLSLALVMCFTPGIANAQTLTKEAKGWTYETETTLGVGTGVYYTNVTGLLDGGYAVINQAKKGSQTSDVLSTSGKTVSFTSLAIGDDDGKWAVDVDGQKASLVNPKTGTVLATTTLDFTPASVRIQDNYIIFVGDYSSDGMPAKVMKKTSSGWAASISTDDMYWVDSDIFLFTTSNNSVYLLNDGKMKLLGKMSAGEDVWSWDGVICMGTDYVATKYFTLAGDDLSWYTGTEDLMGVGDNVVADCVLYKPDGTVITSNLPLGSRKVTGDYLFYGLYTQTLKVYSGEDGNLVKTIDFGAGNTANSVLYRDGTYRVTLEDELDDWSTICLDEDLNKVPMNARKVGELKGKDLYAVGTQVGTSMAYDVVDENGATAKIGSYTVALAKSATAYGLPNLNVTANDGTVFFAKNAAGKYGAVKADGTVVIPFEYDNYCADEDMGFALVCKDGVWGFWQFGKTTTDIAKATVGGISKSYAYTGKAVTPAPKVTYNGTTLKEGTDYVVSYKDDKSVGTATVAVSGIGKYSGVACKTYKIAKATTQALKASNVTLSKASLTYTGKKLVPTVTVKNAAGKTLAKNTDYTVAYYDAAGKKVASPTAVGTYTVKVAGKGGYSGTVSKTYKINPKGTTVSSVAAASKGFTVKWSKQATQTTGYQVRYSTSSGMKNAVTKTVSKTGTTSLKVTKLKAKTKYYVQVRTYKKVTVNGKTTTYYSAWSAKKAVTTKA